MTQEIVRKYSEAFKKKVVAEYEKGASLTELKHRYGIGGATTIKNWVNKYAREGVRHKMVVIQQPEEQLRVSELEAEVKRLKEVIYQLSVDKFMLERTVEVAEKSLGHEVKKKTLMRSSNRRKNTSK